MMNDTDSAYQDTVARGNMYSFLSAIYLQAPTQDLVKKIIDVEFIEELASLFSEGSVAELRNYSGAVDIEKAVVLIKQDYMDLFAVPAGRYVMPFEDIYRGTRMDGHQERGPLLGTQAISVKIMYRMAGAEMERSCKELPTHIGVELGFMDYLCKRQATAINNEWRTATLEEEIGTTSDSAVYREFQRRFLNSHLNDWFPQLNKVIQEKANTHFYRGLAQVTEEFIASDTESLMTQTIYENPAQVIQVSSAIHQSG